MFERMRHHLTYSNVMVTLLAVVVLGSGAVALGGVMDKQGRITACYVKKGDNRGDVRLLVKGRCTGKEKKIVWNQRGASGKRGLPGPSTGPAGGDLAGDFPNPTIAAGAVTAADLAVGSVGASQMANFSRREATGSVTGGTQGNNIWNHGTATASCIAGEQLIAGNAVWDDELAGDPMTIVEILPDFAAETVTVKGATDVVANRTLRAIAICLER